MAKKTLQVPRPMFIHCQRPSSWCACCAKPAVSWRGDARMKDCSTPLCGSWWVERWYPPVLLTNYSWRQYGRGRLVPPTAFTPMLFRLSFPIFSHTRPRPSSPPRPWTAPLPFCRSSGSSLPLPPSPPPLLNRRHHRPWFGFPLSCVSRLKCARGEEANSALGRVASGSRPTGSSHSLSALSGPGPLWRAFVGKR
jgi:hypothetical protein